MSGCSRIAIALTVLITILVVVSYAQNQGTDQFDQFRERHKYTFQLMNMVRNISEINKDPKYTLTQTQAKQVLAVLEPLRSKPKLTQDQAKETIKALKKVFTVNQLNAMARIKSPRRVPDGSRLGGSSAGPRQADRPRLNPDAMKDFNPFYSKVKAGDEFAARRVKRWNEFFAALQEKAKGTKTTKPTATKKK